MLSWLFTPEPATLVLKPDASMVGCPGFPTSDPLTLTGLDGETIAAFLDKFNTYRGPENQIRVVYDAASGVHPISLDVKVRGVMTVIVKKSKV
jgi:hypothetical protein